MLLASNIFLRLPQLQLWHKCATVAIAGFGVAILYFLRMCVYVVFKFEVNISIVEMCLGRVGSVLMQ